MVAEAACDHEGLLPSRFVRTSSPADDVVFPIRRMTTPTHPRDVRPRGRRPTRVVSERLGHATVAITLGTYSHAIPAMQEEAAAKIAGLVFKRT